MNRAFVIVGAPVLLVAAGYVVVLHSMGISPGYARLAMASLAVAALLWWLSRRNLKKAETHAKSGM